ncbi:MAG TPA: universal stress protein [Burkholderiaceae bacterium]|nr:universal stress protein [Burkholderiaceae bacterium]
MLRHILVATDGSSLSTHAVRKAVTLASKLGARMTALHVTPPFHVLTFVPEQLEDTEAQYLEHARNRAATILADVTEAARAADVPCEVVTLAHEHPYEAIISTAQAKDCDMIAMASHGRRGIQATIIGSETQKVLTHSKLPVLVFR